MIDGFSKMEEEPLVLFAEALSDVFVGVLPPRLGELWLVDIVELGADEDEPDDDEEEEEGGEGEGEEEEEVVVEEVEEEGGKEELRSTSAS